MNIGSNAKLKSELYKLIFEIQSQIIISSFEFYQQKNYYPTLVPITSNSISSPMGAGSDSIPISVKLFDKRTFLSDSMQFNLEYLLRFGKSGVWYIMPSFRGEDHSERHLNQFFHSEAEIVGNLEDIVILVQEYIDFITNGIKSKLGDEIKKIIGDVAHIDKLISYHGNYPRIQYKDAIKLLEEFSDCVCESISGEIKITYAGEKKLIEEFDGIVWLTHFPSSMVPFYQAKAIFNEKVCLCGDLLFGMGEVVGAGERHITSESVRGSLNSQNIYGDSYQWYIDLKEEMPLKTAGFGLGIERYIMWMLKIQDIRCIQIFERLKGGESSP